MPAVKGHTAIPCRTEASRQEGGNPGHLHGPRAAAGLVRWAGSPSPLDNPHSASGLPSSPDRLIARSCQAVASTDRAPSHFEGD